MVNRKRTKQVVVRFTEEEYAALEEKLNIAQLSKTDFFIKCVTDKPIYVVNGIRDVYYELSRIGANLNQIAKNLNGGFYQSADKELREIRQDFSIAKNELLRLIERVK